MYKFSLSPSQWDLWSFTRVTVCWGKGNNQNFCELLNTGSELTLIPKMLLWSTHQSKGSWSSGDQWSFSSDPFHSVSSEFPNPSCNYFPKYMMHNWNTHTQQLANSPPWGFLSLPPYSLDQLKFQFFRTLLLTPCQIRLALIIGSHSTIMGSVSPLCQLLLITF